MNHMNENAEPMLLNMNDNAEPMLLIGMLLYAKDGESFGNGIIYGRFRRRGQFVYQIETDFGNRIECDCAGVKRLWSHSKEPMCVTQWRENRMRRIQTPFIGPAGDPQFCPYCSCCEVRDVNEI